MSEENAAQAKIRKTVEFLRKAQLNIQTAQTFMKFAKRQCMLNGIERRLLDRVDLDLMEAIDQIEVVRNAQEIAIK